MLFTNTERFHFAKDPAVVRLGDTYFLYFSGLQRLNSEKEKLVVGIARSKDMEAWEFVEFMPLTQACEQNGVGAPGAYLENGCVHLFYQTYGNGKHDAICHAVSTDGIHFEKDGSNPIFSPTDDWCCGRAIDADAVAFGDKLFLYFWAFNRVEPEAELETVEAGLLLEQLLADSIPAMEAEGLHTVTDLAVLNAADNLRIRADSIRRVADNVVDNLVKYADRNYPVTVVASRTDDTLTVHVSNVIGQKDHKTSSTRIGVKTCVNMMKSMNGAFETKTEGDTFTSSMTLPLHNTCP